MRVIDENGTNIGVIGIDEALKLSYEAGLDLVEIRPEITPPVCSIMDFAKYRFEQKKKQKKQKQNSKTIAPKEVRLRPVSGSHDVEIKINQIKKFLAEKRVVAVSIQFKKREMAFQEQGADILKRIITAVEEISRLENPPRFEGKSLRARLLPKTT